MEVVSTPNNETHALLSSAYEDFSRGLLSQGIGKLEEALAGDFENAEVVSALKCAHFWRDRFATAEERTDRFEKAEYLVNQWKSFLAFAARAGDESERCLTALKRLVYKTGLELYESLLEGHSPGGRDGDILFRIGRCYKSLGAYDLALQNLDAANQVKKDQAEIMAELADCYALVNEMQISKVFFREAFFLNPQAVDCDSLESGMIRRLAEKTRENGHQGASTAEWLPVYGVLYGVFTVRRELRSIEYGKLRQSIYAMEVELRDDPKKKETLMPRLLNRYFWLVDHYLTVKEGREKIDEVLLKIKALNPLVYEHYTK